MYNTKNIFKLKLIKLVVYMTKNITSNTWCVILAVSRTLKITWLKWPWVSPLCRAGVKASKSSYQQLWRGRVTDNVHHRAIRLSVTWQMPFPGSLSRRTQLCGSLWVVQISAQTVRLYSMHNWWCTLSHICIAIYPFPIYGQACAAAECQYLNNNEVVVRSTVEVQ